MAILKKDKIPNNLETDQDVLIQGEGYEEFDAYEEGTDVNSMQGEENEKKKKNGKTAVMVTVIAVFFVGLILIIFMLMSKGGGGGLSAFTGDEQVEDSEILEEPLYVYPETTIVISRGQEIEVPVDQTTGEPIMPEWKYTESEVAALREVGYTGTEIEDFQYAEIEPKILIEDAEAKAEAWTKKHIAPYFDMASDEWKSLLNTTWYGLPEVEEWDKEGNYSNYSYTLNADYEKVPAYGYQLFIKVFLNDAGEYAFLQTTPQRYLELDDSGNIVVEITYTKSEDGKKFITNIKETRVD